MCESPFIRVVKWEEFQHYKKKSPPWIKLYRSALTDYEIGQLEMWERWALVALWLLAAETNNEIPLDLGWLKQRMLLNGRTPPLVSLQVLGKIEVVGVSREALEKSLTKDREESREEGEAVFLPNGRKTGANAPEVFHIPARKANG